MQLNTGGFTVKEYRIYRSVISAPQSVPESQIMHNIANGQKISVDEVRKTTEKIQAILSKNKWFGTPESEVRHASDWKGEEP